MTSKWTCTTLLAASISAAGCDAQHDVDYPGQALWTLLGAIVTGDAQIDEDTSAAIFWSNAGTHLDVLEQVEVEGNFPAEFTLRAFEPPPPPAQISLADVGIAALDIAFGLIVAVDRESAPFYPVVTTSDPEITGDALAPGETLRLEEQEPRPWLRGGAPGHLVAYLSAAPPASAVCIANFTPGYNLLSLTPKTSADIASSEACDQQAEGLALEAYNAEQGTSFTPETLWDDAQAQADVGRAAARIECELGCEPFKLKSALVSPDARVTLEMQANPELVDWF
jgi:hypothetical protein